MESVDIDLVRRFLTFGRTDGSYFAVNDENAHSFTDHVDCIKRLLSNEQGLHVVDIIKQTCVENRAPRRSPLIYALALCAKSSDKRTKNAAYRSLVEVCRLPTHLFKFIKFTEILSGDHKGWGRAQRKGVSEWYNQHNFLQNPLKLLKLGCKYRRRSKFSHKDVIRLGHIKPANQHVAFAIRYLVKGNNDLSDFDTKDVIINTAFQFVLGLERIRALSPDDTSQLCELIKRYRFSHEHIPSSYLTSKEVWECLVFTMPLTALIRHLGKLSNLGLLNPGEVQEIHVIDKIRNPDVLSCAKIHPFSLLTAWNSYKRGYSGPHRRLVWVVNPRIANALEIAFYNSMSYARPTGSRILLAIDGSNTMLQQPAFGMPEVSARSAAVATVFSIYKIEKQSNGQGQAEMVLLLDTVTPIAFNTDMDDLESASQKFSDHGTGSNPNPCIAIDWALENGKEFDAFVLFNVTGTCIVNSARQYRESMDKPHCRFVNVSMTSNKYDVTDPLDRDMLNVVGLDSKAVSIILDFIRNE